MSAACCGAEASGFDASRALFETVVSFLDGAEAAALSHAELAERLDTDGRALLRRLLADHLELRAHREARVEVVDAGGVARGRVESGHGRALAPDEPDADRPEDDQPAVADADAADEPGGDQPGGRGAPRWSASSRRSSARPSVSRRSASSA